MLLAHLKLRVNTPHVAVLVICVRALGESIVKRFVHVGCGVKEHGGVCARGDCLDQCTNQTHVCSLAEELSLEWK